MYSYNVQYLPETHDMVQTRTTQLRTFMVKTSKLNSKEVRTHTLSLPLLTLMYKTKAMMRVANIQTQARIAFDLLLYYNIVLPIR